MDGESSSKNSENQPCRRLDFGLTSEEQLTKEGENDIAKDIDDNGGTVHTNVAEEIIPKVGAEFDNESEAYAFYNRYAKVVGFSVRKSKGHKNPCGRWTNRLFFCSCEGIRSKDKREIDVKYHRPETRFGCQARLKLNTNVKGKLQVTEFISKHTHVLASPSKSIFLRSQRNITSMQKVEAELADSSGIAPKATIELMSRRVGGLENLGFIPDDYRNYLRKKRSEAIKIGDTGGLMEYMQRMQLEDPNFSYAIQLDIDDLITNIFWADARMKIDYGYFGDVVCFDTTYKKNKDGRPLGLFVGVNHHKQTIIFGAALLYDESSDTFKWLFDTFVEAMSGKKPITILTDQDAAMASALAEKWPETHHRLCIWHMYQNAAKHLSHVFEKHSSFAKDFQSCIYDFDEEHDFVVAWNKMLDHYGLTNNNWLKKQFEVREKWALVYGRKIFCADMVSTQRSESMNSQIKNYINYNFDLLRFFQHFQRLVNDRRYEELKADFKASQSRPFLHDEVEILEHARRLYTPAIFSDFCNQLWSAWNYEVHNLDEVGAMSTYNVLSSRKPLPHVVTFDSSNLKVECSCGKFEFCGILCAHALKVLLIRNIKRLPEEYILKRWRSDAKVGCVYSNSSPIEYNDPQVNIRSRHKFLAKLYDHLAARASLADSCYRIAIDKYNEALRDVETTLKGLSFEEGNSSGEIHGSKNKGSLVPRKNVKVKGIKFKEQSLGGSNRKKGALEKATTRKRSNKNNSKAKDHVMSNNDIREERSEGDALLPIHIFSSSQMSQSNNDIREERPEGDALLLPINKFSSSRISQSNNNIREKRSEGDELLPVHIFSSSQISQEISLSEFENPSGDNNTFTQMLREPYLFKDGFNSIADMSSSNLQINMSEANTTVFTTSRSEEEARRTL